MASFETSGMRSRQFVWERLLHQYLCRFAKVGLGAGVDPSDPAIPVNLYVR
jgi:hypothetical protein